MSDNARFVGMAAAVLGGGVRQYVAHQAEIEHLNFRLLAALAPGRTEDAQAEIERRRDLFARTWTTSPRTGEPPDIAALRSVLDDVVMGRWLL